MIIFTKGFDLGSALEDLIRHPGFLEKKGKSQTAAAGTDDDDLG